MWFREWRGDGFPKASYERDINFAALLDAMIFMTYFMSR